MMACWVWLVRVEDAGEDAGRWTSKKGLTVELVAKLRCAAS